MPQIYLDENGNPIGTTYLDEQGNPVSGYRPPSFETLKKATEAYPKQEGVPGLFSGVKDYTYPGGEVGPVAPGETLPHALNREMIAAPFRAARNVASMPLGIAQSVTAEPSPQEMGMFATGGPAALALKRILYDPMAAEQAKVRPSYEAGRPVSAFMHGFAGSLPVVGPWIGEKVSEAEKGHVGAAPEFGMEYAGFRGAGEVSKKAGPLAREVFGTSPAGAVKKGYANIIRSLRGIKPDFPEHLDRLAQRGHFNEFANTSSATSIREASKDLRDYMNRWEDETINPAIARHPDGFLSGDAIANEVESLRNPHLDALFPENRLAIDSEVSRYRGQQVPLAQGRELLTKLNAMSRSLQEMSPTDKAAAEHATASKAVLNKVTEAVRDQLYGTLENLGERGIREAQKDYGSMKELQETLYKNIPRAELAEASKPKYREVPIGMVYRHPMIAGTLGYASIASGHPMGLLAIPAVEAIRTSLERGKTPNAFLRKSLRGYRGGPERVPLPTPPPTQGTLFPQVPPPPTTPQVPPPTGGQPVPPPITGGYNPADHPTLNKLMQVQETPPPEPSPLANIPTEDLQAVAKFDPTVIEELERRRSEQPTAIDETLLPQEEPVIRPEDLPEETIRDLALKPSPPLKEAPPIPGTVGAFKAAPSEELQRSNIIGFDKNTGDLIADTGEILPNVPIGITDEGGIVLRSGEIIPKEPTRAVPQELPEVPPPETPLPKEIGGVPVPPGMKVTKLPPATAEGAETSPVMDLKAAKRERAARRLAKKVKPEDIVLSEEIIPSSTFLGTKLPPKGFIPTPAPEIEGVKSIGIKKIDGRTWEYGTKEGESFVRRYNPDNPLPWHREPKKLGVSDIRAAVKRLENRKFTKKKDLVD